MNQDMSNGRIDGLIKKIRDDGFVQAESQAKKIIEQAQSDAQEILSQAKIERDNLFADLKKEMELERLLVKNSIEQGIRDLILQLTQSIEKYCYQILKEDLGKELTGDKLVQVIERLIDLWCNSQKDGLSLNHLKIFVSEEQANSFSEEVLLRLKRKLKDGSSIIFHPNMDFGFKLSFENQEFHHNFTPQAISDGLKIFIGNRISKYLSFQW